MRAYNVNLQKKTTKLTWVRLELLGTREKPITSWFKTASNWHKIRYSHHFTQLLMVGVFPWPPRVKLPRNSWSELGIGGSVRCPWCKPKVNDDLWQILLQPAHSLVGYVLDEARRQLEASKDGVRGHFMPSCVALALPWSCMVVYVMGFWWGNLPKLFFFYVECIKYL